ncbi:hypothetical protein KAU43_00735 [candidate division WOR-3 bacterium]|jgi:hypothetical protein|nr:hypothetical protein [candidate division WOR-3 bacterium]
MPDILIKSALEAGSFLLDSKIKPSIIEEKNKNDLVSFIYRDPEEINLF